MRHFLDRQRFHTFTARDQISRALVIATTAATFVCSTGIAQAQSGKLGTYAGTINVSGTEPGPKVNYVASIKISLPVSERDGSSISAEFLSGEAPNATVLISQWDISHKEKSADSGGQFNSYTCSLAAPTEIPMTPTGVLNVDLKTKKHTLSITLLSTKDLAFNCVHSRSGAYKKKQGVILYIGTGAPGMQDAAPQPFSDPARLNAKYTLLPSAATNGRGPIIQEWDLRLTK